MEWCRHRSLCQIRRLLGLEIWSRLPRCPFRCLRRLPRLLVLRPLWPPPPGCFQFPSLLWERGWPRCLGLRVVSLTLEPRQQLPRLWLSSLSTLLGIRCSCRSRAVMRAPSLVFHGSSWCVCCGGWCYIHC